MKTIIVVDDDPDILAPVESMLTGEGYRVRTFEDPNRALAYLVTQSVDLAIFDITMPEMNGYDLLRSARERLPHLPVIFLSSKSEEQDQIIGFTLGADDFVTKPFSKHLLLFRIQSVLKRHDIVQGGPKQTIEVGPLSIDRDRNLVAWSGQQVELTVTESLLLIALAEKPGQVKKRDQLMDAAYEGTVYVSDRTIDSHVKNIRHKFRAADVTADPIATVFGLGYKLSL